MKKNGLLILILLLVLTLGIVKIFFGFQGKINQNMVLVKKRSY